LRGEGVIRFRDGKAVRVLGTVQDVTAMVEAEVALADAYVQAREAAERLRELDTTKNTFISAVAHDLRAPLATISGFASTLAQRFSDFPEDQARDIISRIGANADRMSRMLANLLDMDRLERGDIRASFVEVDLSDTVLRIVHSLDSDREVHVDSGRVTAWVDEGLVERVIENLVSNAFRHTPPATPVWVKLNQTTEGAEILVEDAGAGVPDELKDTIFQAFKRGVNETSMGTGLGLFLVAQFAELHHGRAWVEDRPGGGASFHVFLPQRPASAAGTVA
jgi:signal transduction histidine kinase